MMIKLYIFHLSLDEISFRNDLMKFCLKIVENKEKSFVNHVLVFEIFTHDMATYNCLWLLYFVVIYKQYIFNNKLRNLNSRCKEPLSHSELFGEKNFYESRIRGKQF